MKKFFVLTTISVVLFVWYACSSANSETTTQQVLKQYRADIEQLLKEADTLISVSQTAQDSKTIQSTFISVRLAYKKVEWLAEYYQPYTARFINGPALEEVEPEDKSIVIQPEGFQVIEELIYPAFSPEYREELVQEVKTLHSNIARLGTTAKTLETTDAHIFDAFRLELFRLISLGLSGFDSPLAHNSIAEAKATIAALNRYITLYDPLLKSKDNNVHKKLVALLAAAEAHLEGSTGFDAFNRMQFIRQYANPLAETLLASQKVLGLTPFTEPRALKADAHTLFAPDAFDPNFYAPDADAYTSEDKIKLGARLFYDPVLSRNGNRSCGSCHQPGKAFTDALKTNTALNNGVALKRNTPTLLNAALQPALFYDTRVAYLEDQAKAVILNKEEMHGSLEEAVKKLNMDTAYKALFSKAYPATVITEHTIKNALASYVRSLISLNSRFDRYMRGEDHALNRQEVDGFNLFMGKAKCGTCHFAPLFNGSNPPNFTRIDAEVLGVPATADTLHPQLDSDEGKFYAYGIPLYRYAFKTPTVRNSAVTGPYMHNGVYNTLEEVVAFYNRGGGRGLGLSIDNQTLPEDNLHLSAYEQKAIVAFMHSLTDERYDSLKTTVPKQAGHQR